MIVDELVVVALVAMQSSLMTETLSTLTATVAVSSVVAVDHVTDIVVDEQRVSYAQQAY